MAMAGRTSLWNGPQLAAQWLAARGPLPRPVSYAIFRETTRPNGGTDEHYSTPNEPHPLAPHDFQHWLLHHRLGGPDGLGLALLVIREVVDPDGAIRECVIERRRGAVDGPLSGEPARVEFVGAARSVRLYSVDNQGRLVETTPAAPPAPPCHDITEAFRGEEDAIRAHFGQAAVVLDRRSPTLFEELAGLSSIVHVRGTDRGTGRDWGCGIGWHGPMPYLLIGDFPRLDHGLALPPAEESAVAAALREHNLTRHEMRFDSEGLCVIASRRDRQDLFIVRPDSDGARVDPYTPGDETVGSNDQRRWIRYAEAHEGRIALDAYQDGASEELVVLTGDGDGQVWRHRIDPDGVELACGPANETAVAMLYRARRSPDGADQNDEVAALAQDAPWPEPPPEADSLLAMARAYAHVLATLRAERDAEPAWPATATRLRTLAEPLRLLGVRGAATAARTLLRRGDRSPPSTADRLRALDNLEQRLIEDLADIQVSAATQGWPDLTDGTPDPAIEDRFPEAAYHHDEARRCLALRRPSAAVFHAMHVARVGLRAIAGDLDAAVIGDWTRLMAAIAKREDLPPAVGDSLRQLRRTWHAPGLLPAEKYTEEEAEAVLDALAGFMRAVMDWRPPPA